MGLLYIEFSYLCKGCIIKGTKLLLAYKEFIIKSSRSELRYKNHLRRKWFSGKIQRCHR